LKNWPALDVPCAGDSDLMLAAADDFGLTAVEQRGDTLRLFFATSAARDAAHAALATTQQRVEPVDVDDEDWARRSQDALGPITVGRITVAPPWASQSTVTIVIAPSMGFGTGHHATTRLCLTALQTIDVSNRSVLDVGTGSGVLAIAAVRLGAAHALGIDHDPDAIVSATENLALNPEVECVEFRVADLMSSPLPRSDVVTANLTGALLVRAADRLRALVRPGGTLVVSGLLAEEEPTVRAAFPSDVAWREQEDEWIALTFRIQI
jgi:ribosomal protein L11 methyltransferase